MIVKTNGKICDFDDCGRDTYGGSRGLCRLHAQQRNRGRELRPIGSKPKIRPLIPCPVGSGIVLVPLTQGYFAMIDAIDGPAVGTFNWCALKREGKQLIYGFHHKARELHRFVVKLAGIPVDVQIDHINGDGLDCRRCNLRRATHMQNLWNRAVRPKSATGIKNVFLNDRGKRPAWVVRVSTGGERHYIGTFRYQEEAEAASLLAEARLHGQFAPGAEAKGAPAP